MDEAEVEEANRLRRAIGRAARRFNVTATDEGLTPTQASILVTVAARGPIGIPALLEHERINPTMLSRVLGHLDTAGLVQRQQHPEDMRSAMFEATDRGAEVYRRVLAERAALVSAAFDRLSLEDRAALRGAVDALERLTEVIE